MNKPIDIEKDLLKQYLNRETFEKAPEGFGLKTMARIRLEAGNVKFGRLFRFTVPLISLLITAIFILMLVLVPETQTGYKGIPSLNFIQDIKLNIPSFRLNLGSLPRIDIPEWSFYFFGALLLLGILDRILSGIFSRNR